MTSFALPHYTTLACTQVSDPVLQVCLNRPEVGNALNTQMAVDLLDLWTRLTDVSGELRCVVCQNQSIDDSAAEVARDMRRAVRERLAAGDRDEQVFAYMVARYGDYVLLKPPFKAGTWALWLGGPLVLLVAGSALLLAARRRKPPVPSRPLDDEERRRLDALLGK